MDALILCGGYATRLGDIAYFTPKQLLPLSGRPVIDYILESIASLDVNKVIVSTNSRFADQFEYWLKLKRAAGYIKPIELVVERTRTSGEKLGAVKGIHYAVKKSNLSDDLLVVAGDNFYNFNLTSMINHFRRYRKTTIALYDTKSIDEARRFGVVTIDGHRIISFEEKPKEPKSTLASTGIYIFPKEILERLDAYVQKSLNADDIGSFLQWLIKETEVHGIRFSGEWFDIGTIDTYRKIFDSYIDRRLL
jgi:glucose-1-phosphate thymidylyltransferase